MNADDFREMLGMGGVPAHRKPQPAPGPYMGTAWRNPGSSPVPTHRTEEDRVEEARERREEGRRAIQECGWKLPQ